METPAKIFACTQSSELAKTIAKQFGVPLGNVNFSQYSDGEFQPSFEESVRGVRIFIIGSTQPSSENLMEMLLMLDAAKRASARHITAVMPLFWLGKTRSQRQTQSTYWSKTDCQTFRICWSYTNHHNGSSRRSNSRFF